MKQFNAKKGNINYDYVLVVPVSFFGAFQFQNLDFMLDISFEFMKSNKYGEWKVDQIPHKTLHREGVGQIVKSIK
jgi:hypothetical protein